VKKTVRYSCKTFSSKEKHSYTLTKLSDNLLKLECQAGLEKTEKMNYENSPQQT